MAEIPQRIWNVFHELDSDNSGFISTVELERMLEMMGMPPEERRRHLPTLLREMDEDDDGQISLEEFARVAELRNLFPPEPEDPLVAQAEAMFAEIDEDGSGTINVDELETVLRGLGLNIKQRRAKARDLMQVLDEDMSGEITKSEFIQAVKDGHLDGLIRSGSLPASTVTSTAATPRKSAAPTPYKSATTIYETDNFDLPFKERVRQLQKRPMPERNPAIPDTISERKRQAMWDLFCVADEDESGAIGCKELTELLQQGEDSASGYSSSRSHITESYVKRIMSFIDTSGDGELEFDEFVRSFHGMFTEDGQASVVDNDVFSAERKALSEEIQQYQATNRVLEAERNDLLNRFEQSRLEHLSQMDTYQKAADQQLEDLSDRNKVLEADVSKLRRIVSEKAESIEELERLLRDQKDENLRLRRSSVPVLRETEGPDPEMMEMIEKQRAQITDLEGKLDTQSQQLQQIEEQWTTTITTYETQLQEFMEGLMLMPELASARDYLQQHNEELQRELKTMKTSSQPGSTFYIPDSSMNSELDELQRQLEESRRSYDEAVRERDYFKSEAEKGGRTGYDPDAEKRLAAAVHELEASRNELMLLHQQYETLRLEKEKLEDPEINEHLREELRAVRIAAQHSEEEVHALNSQHDNDTRTMAALEERLREMQGEVRDAVLSKETAEGELAHLQASLDMQVNDAVNKTRAALEEAERARDANGTLQEELRRLKSSLANKERSFGDETKSWEVRYNETVSRLEATTRELESVREAAQNAQLKSKSDLQAAQAREENLKNTITSLQEELQSNQGSADSLQSQLATAKAELRAATSAREETALRLSALDARLNQLQEELVQSNSECSELSTQLRMAAHEKEALAMRQTDLENLLSKANMELDRKAGEVDQYAAERGSLQARMNKAEQSLQELQVEHASLQTSYGQLQNEHKQLRDSLQSNSAQYEGTVAQLRKELEGLQGREGDLQRRLSQAKDDELFALKKLEISLREAKYQQETAEQDAQAARQEAEIARRKVEELEVQLNSLRMSMDELKEARARDVGELQGSLKAARAAAELAEKEVLRIRNDKTSSQQHFDAMVAEVDRLKKALADSKAQEQEVKALLAETKGAMEEQRRDRDAAGNKARALENELASLRTHLSKESAEKDELLRQLQDHRQSKEVMREMTLLQNRLTTTETDLRRQLTDRSEELTQTKAELEAANKRLASLQQERNMLDGKLQRGLSEADSKAMTASQRADELSSAMRVLQAKHDHVVTELSAAQAEVERLKARNDHHEVELSSLQRSLSDFKEQRAREIGELNGSLRAAVLAREHAEHELDLLQKGHTSRSMELTERALETERLREQFHEASERERAARAEAQELRMRLEKLTVENDSNYHRLQHLEMESRQLADLRVDLKNAQDKAMALQNKVVQYEREQEQTEAAMRRARDLEEAVRNKEVEMRSQLSKLRTDAEVATKKLEVAESEAARKEELARQEADQLRTDLQTARLRAEDLQSEMKIRAMKQEAAENSLSTVQEENSYLQQRVQSQLAEIQTLKRIVADIRESTAGEVGDLQAQLRGLQSTLRRAEEEIERAEQERPLPVPVRGLAETAIELERLKSELHETAQREAHGREELIALRSERQTTQRRCNELEEEIRLLKSKLASLQVTSDNTAMSLDSHVRELKTLRTKTAMVGEDKTNIERRLHDIQITLTETQQENETLRSLCDEYKHKNSELSISMQEQARTPAKQAAEIQRLTSLVTERELEAQSVTSANTTLRADNERLRARVADLLKEHSSPRDELADAERQVAKLQREITRLREENDRLLAAGQSNELSARQELENLKRESVLSAQNKDRVQSELVRLARSTERGMQDQERHLTELRRGVERRQTQLAGTRSTVHRSFTTYSAGSSPTRAATAATTRTPSKWVMEGWEDDFPKDAPRGVHFFPVKVLDTPAAKGLGIVDRSFLRVTPDGVAVLQRGTHTELASFPMSSISRYGRDNGLFSMEIAAGDNRTGGVFYMATPNPEPVFDAVDSYIQ
eukprot:m.218110 g.218110  ORF g.218110 m.218110 type:complete len:2030 (+) comp22247_c0_seq1:95-6184(+)